MMEEERSESSGGSRITLLALGVVGLIALAVGAYAAKGPLGGAQSASSKSAEPTAAPDVAMQTVAIPVEGMSCAACAASIKKSLKAVDGVGSAEVSLERREVVVRYAGEKTTPERLTSEINELGYKASLPEEAKKADAAEAAPPESRVKTATIPVQGMACESCVETVEGLLRSLPGVEDARVSLKEQEALVRYVDGEVTPERLAEEIRAQGFDAGTPSTEGRK
ncbi:heavy-metal-associated domain-containing protein [Tautonia sociabilis]|uniref:HMA domain-containing protein n=1 Tax=Tautonia sociabilis TaxID=2080755 RepID=A0A432ML53_9BACT|nr:heavy metal-associated domain-containing protein [Tautonia sociabilis]RUL87937.1 hypothetical protein TsocGM_09410 [Tautonia sociabilis]